MDRAYYTYIILCSDKSYYTGVTNDVWVRFEEHCNNDHSRSYTYTRRPLKLVYYEEFDYVIDAIAREKQIKRWTRAKKKALIERNKKSLIELSKNKANKK